MSSTQSIGLGTALAVVFGAAAVGFGAVYLTLGGRDNAAAPRVVDGPQQGKQAPGPAAAVPGGKLNSGQMTAFVFKKAAEAIEPISFKDGAGNDLSLKAWEGRVVLLNLWATWCAPCLKEMPALDRLQAELGSKDFEVVALAVDRTGAEGARKFLDKIKAANLKLYVDASARSSSTLRVVGMPTTILIDRQGREIGRLVGPAEWDSEDAKRLVRGVM